MLRVDDTRIRQKLGISIQGNSATGVILFLSSVDISGAEFEKHWLLPDCFNISEDILDSVFYHFSGTVYYAITFLIYIVQKR